MSPRFEWGLTTVTPGTFSRHTRLITENGFLLSPLGATHDSTGNVYLTFDDGYESVFTEAYPILSAAGGRGTVFLIAEYVGKLNHWDTNLGFLTFPHLTMGQIRELIRAGWTIGSHGATHRCLLSMNPSELKKEIERSKSVLEDSFGVRVDYFSPPFGKASRRIIDLVLATGYRKVCLPWTLFRNKYPADSCIYRWNIYKTGGPASFARILESGPRSRFHIGRQMVISFCNGATIAVNRIG